MLFDIKIDYGLKMAKEPQFKFQVAPPRELKTDHLICRHLVFNERIFPYFSFLFPLCFKMSRCCNQNNLLGLSYERKDQCDKLSIHDFSTTRYLIISTLFMLCYNILLVQKTPANLSTNQMQNSQQSVTCHLACVFPRSSNFLPVTSH